MTASHILGVLWTSLKELPEALSTFWLLFPPSVVQLSSYSSQLSLGSVTVEASHAGLHHFPPGYNSSYIIWRCVWVRCWKPMMVPLNTNQMGWHVAVSASHKDTAVGSKNLQNIHYSEETVWIGPLWWCCCKETTTEEEQQQEDNCLGQETTRNEH